jgi:hypothetical protein
VKSRRRFLHLNECNVVSQHSVECTMQIRQSVAPMRSKMDHLALGVHSSICTPCSDDPRPMLGHIKKRSLDLALDSRTTALYLKAKVLCAVILHDSH